MALKGFFVDDTETDIIYATLLSTTGDAGLSFEYRTVSEAASLATEIFDARPDIVALDFRLDENPDMIDPKKSYNGSGLAQLLRDKAIQAPEYDFPIILISSEQNFERYYRPDGTAHDLFDRTYKKDATAENSAPVKSQLLSLCNGYQALKAVWGNGGDRLSVFGLGDGERELVATQDLRAAIVSAGAPHIAARTIFKGIVDRPGLLLSDQDVAARLGVSELGEVEQILMEHDIAYRGIFHEGWRRWWAHRLEDWAINLFGGRPTNLLGSARVSVLREKLKVDVTPAVSTWNRSSDERFAFSCAVCHRPGEIRHSVTAFDPHAPKYAHRKRICWDCIETGQYIAAKLEVDDVDSDLAAEVARKSRDTDASS